MEQSTLECTCLMDLDLPLEKRVYSFMNVLIDNLKCMHDSQDVSKFELNLIIACAVF